MIPIFEMPVMKEMVKVSCCILHKHFYYEDEMIHRFLDMVVEEVSEELSHFQSNAREHVLDELCNDDQARLHFTCYFTNVNLRYIFINKLHFTEQELKAFEDILPRYIGGARHEPETEHKRTHD